MNNTYFGLLDLKGKASQALYPTQHITWLNFTIPPKNPCSLLAPLPLPPGFPAKTGKSLTAVLAFFHRFPPRRRKDAFSCTSITSIQLLKLYRSPATKDISKEFFALVIICSLPTQLTGHCSNEVVNALRFGARICIIPCRAERTAVSSDLVF